MDVEQRRLGPGRGDVAHIVSHDQRRGHDAEQRHLRLLLGPGDAAVADDEHVRVVPVVRPRVLGQHLRVVPEVVEDEALAAPRAGGVWFSRRGQVSPGLS